SLESSRGIGDYIASGFNFVEPSSRTTVHTTHEQSSPALNISRTGYGSSPSPFSTSEPLTVHDHAPITTNLSFGYQAANATGNASLYLGDCWAQWSSYWSRNDSANAVRTTHIGGTSTFTTTDTNVWTQSAESGYTTSFTYLYTWTKTLVANGFTYTTQTSTQSEDITESQKARPATTETYIYTMTSTETPEYTEITPHVTVPTPHCVLPSQVPQCQSQWEDYERGMVTLAKYEDSTVACTDYGTACMSSQDSLYSTLEALSSLYVAPSCSQASLNSGICGFLRDRYITSWRAYGPNHGGGYYEGPMSSVGYVNENVTYANGSIGLTYGWPTSSQLGPGCTLGCGRCAVTGGSVRLIYWPTTQTSNAEPLVVSDLGTYFTSPTVYISYSKIYASDSCSGVGSTYTNVLLPIPNSMDLSSLWETNGAYLVPQTASFNYADLNEPVPQSIYERQPQCAIYEASVGFYQMGNTGVAVNTTCPRTAPYEPMLVVPSSIIRQIDPAWASCGGDQRGVYDPPHALHEGAVAAAPTPSSVSWGTETNLPAPASSPPIAGPTKTSSPVVPFAPDGSHGGDPSSGQQSHPSDPSNGSGDNGQVGTRPNDPSPGEPSSDDSNTNHPPLPNAQSAVDPLNGSSNDGQNGASSEDPSSGDPGSGDSPGGDPPFLGAQSAVNPSTSDSSFGGSNSAGSSDDPSDPNNGDGSHAGLEPTNEPNSSGASPQDPSTDEDAGNGVHAAYPQANSDSDPGRQTSGQQAGGIVAGIFDGDTPSGTSPSEHNDTDNDNDSTGGRIASAFHGSATNDAQNEGFFPGDSVPSSGGSISDTPSYALLTIASNTLTAISSSSAVIIGSHTLSPDSPILTTLGATIRLLPSGLAVQSSQDSSNIAFSPLSLPHTSGSPNTPQETSAVEVEAEFTAGGETFTAFELAGSESSAVIVSPDRRPTTLQVGGPGTSIGGVAVSLGSEGVSAGSETAKWSTVTEGGSVPPGAGAWETGRPGETGVQTANASGAQKNVDFRTDWRLSALAMVAGFLFTL
ncbi:MAG: hypothetical protein M1820_007206, partial [Bogoriella megaspora]